MMQYSISGMDMLIHHAWILDMLDVRYIRNILFNKSKLIKAVRFNKRILAIAQQTDMVLIKPVTV